VAKDQNLHLLILEESSSDAESLANELREAGHSINLHYASDLTSLETELSGQAPDIIICGSGPELPDAAGVKAVLDRHANDAPVIAIGDDASEDSVVAARKAGITALVSYERPDHLHVVFRHEAEIVGLRHRLAAFTSTLQASEKRAHALIENSSDAIAYIHDGMHVYANKPYMELFEIRSLDDIAGIPVLDMISNSQQDTLRNFLKQYDHSGADDGENTLNIDCINPGGEQFNTTMEFTPASMDGESCTQIIIRVNYGINSELEKKIKTLSREDMLTGLWNRQYFMQRLEKELESPTRGSMQRALIYLTLDNFKVIREEVGIATSDLVLCDIANLLNKERNKHDLLSRFGDYSFALLKIDTDMEKLQATCDKLLKDIANHLTEVEGRTFTMTASIGICEINRYASDVQKIISFADMACEVARTSGGNQCHTHSTVIDESLEADMEKNGELIIRETIDNERFYLVFQPIVSLKGDKTHHYEVLLRITDADGHVILPGQFLSIAERSDKAAEIDRWVIDKAFSTLAEYRNGNEATFYIKIAGTNLSDPEFPDWVGSRLKKYKLDGEAVVFEISERTATHNLNTTVNFISRMHSMNCRTAVEHFGVSDQAAQFMARVPADIFKIDGSLIGGMSDEQEIQARVKSLAVSAREQQALCIAERVDDARTLALLWQYGFDAIQGYFVQEPAKELGYEFESEIV
jgi:diguanylate cyclase (GGDEF)-like protein